MKRKKVVVMTAVAGILAMAACESDTSGPQTGEPTRALGILEYHGSLVAPDGVEWHVPDSSEVAYFRPPQPLEAPDGVTRGVPFTVRATTVGDGCTEPDSAEVTRTGNTAEITAFDIRKGEVCILIARFLTRDVTLQFDSPGEATIRLIGRRITNGVEHPDQVVVERKVTVQDS